MKRSSYISLLLIPWLLLLATFVWAASVKLSWQPNKESDLKGYNVYCDGMQVGFTNTTSFSHATGGNLYMVRAVNTSGVESINSNVIITGVITIY